MNKPWSNEEQSRLQEGVRLFIGESRHLLESFQSLPWTKVSDHVGTRTWGQCRMKWFVSVLFAFWYVFKRSFNSLLEVINCWLTILLTVEHILLSDQMVQCYNTCPCAGVNNATDSVENVTL